MEIREILPWDKQQFLTLVRGFYSLSAVVDAIPLEYAEKTFELLMSDTPYLRCFVAANDKNVIAAYCLCAITWSNEAGGLCVWLDEIMVSPALQGQGIGRKLIAAAKAAYPSAARFRLEITKANQRAMALYASLGFESLPYQQMVLDS